MYTYTTIQKFGVSKFIFIQEEIHAFIQQWMH